MTDQTQCPKCASEDIYADGNLWVCPMCSHEWSALAATATAPVTEELTGVRDASGNLLADGDTVTVLKELKIKGAKSSVKVGTKVKNIRLVDGPDNHDIQCKLDGVGTIYLKSEFVRKA